MTEALNVALVGCGLMGGKRARATGTDRLISCFDPDSEAAESLAGETGSRAAATLEDLLAASPDVIIVATPHNRLAEVAISALEAGSHVLVEKPAGLGVEQVESIASAAERAGRRVKVGFNHRFAPGIQRAVTEAQSGRFAEVMFARARYGHGGRLGYEREWRLRPEASGGGELVDQGMHLIDLFHWLLGPLPLHSALLRNHYWDAPVEDNVVFTLAEPGRSGPWATAHASWTEWKNLFSLEIYCRTGKLQVDGLARSYGSQRLSIHRMGPELGPPDTEVIDYPPEDSSWEREWTHFREALVADDGRELLGDLEAARYAWTIVEEAYAHERS